MNIIVTFVLAEPVIVVEPVNSQKITPTHLTMPCNATGKPRPNIFWLFNGVLLQTTASSKYTMSQSGSLTIYVENTNDAGLYTCIATNIHASVNHSATLIVQGKNYRLFSLFIVCICNSSTNYCISSKECKWYYT